jgi:hypothetical protein
MVDSSRPFEETCTHRLKDFPKDKDNRFLRKVDNYLPHYTVSHFRGHNLHKLVLINTSNYIQIRKYFWEALFVIQITTEKSVWYTWGSTAIVTITGIIIIIFLLIDLAATAKPLIKKTESSSGWYTLGEFCHVYILKNSFSNIHFNNIRSYISYYSNLY